MIEDRIRMAMCFLWALFNCSICLGQDWPILGDQNVVFTFNSGNPNIGTYPDGQHIAVDIEGPGNTPVKVPNTADLWEIFSIDIPSYDAQQAGEHNIAVALRKESGDERITFKHLIEDPTSVSLYGGEIGDWYHESPPPAMNQMLTNGETFALVAPVSNLLPNSPQFAHLHVEFLSDISSPYVSILSHPDSPYSFSSGNYVDPISDSGGISSSIEFGPYYIFSNTCQDYILPSSPTVSPILFDNVQFYYEMLDDLGFKNGNQKSDLLSVSANQKQRFDGIVGAPHRISYTVKDKLGVGQDIANDPLAIGTPELVADTQVPNFGDVLNSTFASTNGFIYTYELTAIIGSNQIAQDANSQTNPIVPHYWNTRLKTGEIWSGQAADVNEEAKYQDGEYTLEVRAEDVAGNYKLQTETLQVDNFKPYVKSIKMTQGGVDRYEGSWDWNANSGLVFTSSPISDLSFVGGPINVNIEFSEEMASATFALDPTIALFFTPLVFPGPAKSWNFTIDPSNITPILPMLSGSFKPSIWINGSDLSGNGLITSAASTINKLDIPKRLCNGPWSQGSSVITGPESKHFMEFAMCDPANPIEVQIVGVQCNNCEAPMSDPSEEDYTPDAYVYISVDNAYLDSNDVPIVSIYSENETLLYSNLAGEMTDDHAPNFCLSGNGPFKFYVEDQLGCRSPLIETVECSYVEVLVGEDLDLYPSFTGIDSQYEVCQGEQYCFDFEVSYAQSDIDLYLSYDFLAINAEFVNLISGSGSLTGQVCFTVLGEADEYLLHLIARNPHNYAHEAIITKLVAQDCSPCFEDLNQIVVNTSTDCDGNDLASGSFTLDGIVESCNSVEIEYREFGEDNYQTSELPLQNMSEGFYLGHIRDEYNEQYVQFEIESVEYNNLEDHLELDFSITQSPSGNIGNCLSFCDWNVSLNGCNFSLDGIGAQSCSDLTFQWSHCQDCNINMSSVCPGTYELKVVDTLTGCSVLYEVVVGNSIQVQYVKDVKVIPTVFAGSVGIKYDLDADAIVSIRLYDLNGIYQSTVMDSEYKAAGTHLFVHTSSDLAPGAYLYSVEACESTKSKIGIKN